MMDLHKKWIPERLDEYGSLIQAGYWVSVPHKQPDDPKREERTAFLHELLGVPNE